MNAETTVAVVLTRPETVLDDYARLLRLAGLTPSPVAASAAPGPLAVCLDRDPRPRSPLPGAASPPWQLDGVVGALLAAGHAPAALQAVAPPAARRHRGGPPVVWQRILDARGLPPLGHAEESADLAWPRLVLASLRTDRRCGLPGCLGALASHLLPTRVALASDLQPAPFIDAWRRLGADAVRGGVIDATVCGAGSDPRALRPVACHLLLASRDLAAVDLAAAVLAGFAPAELPLPQAAAAAGLGCGAWSSVRLVGDAGAALPRVDLAPAARYRPSGKVRRDAGAAARRRWEFAPPWAFLQARRIRRTLAATAWGRLQGAYERSATVSKGGGR